MFFIILSHSLADINAIHAISLSEDTRFLLFRDAITNEAVNDCLKQSLEELRPYMKTGIDSLDLEPTDPLMINDFEVNREIPPVTIQTKLNNVGIKVMIYILIVISCNHLDPI